MNPRLIIYGLAFLAIAGVVWAGVHVWNKAQRLDQVEREYSDFKAAIADSDRKAAEARKAAEQRSLTLKTTLDSVSQQLDELRQHPPKASVKYVPVEGEPCPHPRIDPDWLRSYNAASDASSLLHTN